MQMTEGPRRIFPLLATVAAQEERIQELLEKLDTATRLELLERQDEPFPRPKEWNGADATDPRCRRR
jgi:hypothetical protein